MYVAQHYTVWEWCVCVLVCVCVCGCVCGCGVCVWCVGGWVWVGVFVQAEGMKTSTV